MTKRIVAALVCAILLMALLPTAAFAAEDISSSPLNLSTPPAIDTTYTAGTGTVEWAPTLSGEPARVTGAHLPLAMQR